MRLGVEAGREHGHSILHRGVEKICAPRQRVPRGAMLLRAHEERAARYFRCFETSFVISNMLTWRFPPNTARSASSALIIVRFVLS